MLANFFVTLYNIKVEKRRKLMATNKFVYLFSEGSASMRELLGGKGANLAEMTRIGLPVPQGSLLLPKRATDTMQTEKLSVMT